MHRKTPGPLEARPAVTAVGAERGRQGRQCRLRAEHFAHLPDVKGRGNGITRHPAPHNGNNCVTGRQFPAPFDSSDTRWIRAGGHRLAVGSTRRDVTVRKQMSMAAKTGIFEGKIWQNPKLGGTTIFC